MSANVPEKAASDLATRFAAAVVMIAVASVAIYVGGWLFRLLVAAGAAVMLVEWGDMHKVRRGWSIAGSVALVVGLLAVTEWLFAAGEMEFIEGIGPVIATETFQPVWKGVAVLAGVGLLFGLLTRRFSMGWGFVYIAIPAFMLLVLGWASALLVFWLMLVTWSTDIFAYFAGRSIGGPKLAPRISPNKTWSGLIGGMVGAGLVGAAAAWAFGLGMPFLIAGAEMGLIAQLGDLYESRVKRRQGVKDSGTLLPGHGGVLDRLDGLLPVIVATLALLMFTLGTL